MTNPGCNKRCAGVHLPCGFLSKCIPTSLGTLELIPLLIAPAALVVLIFRALKLPALLGYLLVGIRIGTHSIGLMADSGLTRYRTGFGFVFRMFSIGPEFSLPKLMTMHRTVFALGSTQVGMSLLGGLAAALLLGQYWRGQRNWNCCRARRNARSPGLRWSCPC